MHICKSQFFLEARKMFPSTILRSLVGLKINLTKTDAQERSVLLNFYMLMGNFTKE